MRSSDIKKKKADEEVYEEVGEEVFGSDTYESPFVIYINNFVYKFNQFKKKKIFIPVMCLAAFLLFVIIVVISFNASGSSKKTGITDITIKTPKVVYLEEETDFSVNVYGVGNLEETKLNFTISGTKVADLKNESLTGSNVTNTIIPKTTGTFYINVKVEGGKQSEAAVSDKIAVCKKLSSDLFDSTIINVEKDSTTRLRFDIGTPDACYEILKYVIEDPSIAAFTTGDKILGIKSGTTKLIITAGTQKLELTIKVL